MKNDELTVRTPLGELVVGIKADPDYPIFNPVLLYCSVQKLLLSNTSADSRHGISHVSIWGSPEFTKKNISSVKS